MSENCFVCVDNTVFKFSNMDFIGQYSVVTHGWFGPDTFFKKETVSKLLRKRFAQLKNDYTILMTLLSLTQL
jgi:hypothetical protein